MSLLYSKMASGAAWMVLFKLLERLTGLCSIIVLARLLVPADFGLVALATAVIAVLEVLGAFNFDIALIQRGDADRSYFDTAWTFNLIVGFATAGALLALSVPTAHFYGDPRLAPIMQALALSPILDASQNIGVVVFRKELQFDREFKFLLAKKLIAVLTTIALAFSWRNYWALVAGILVGRFFGTLISYVVSSYRPRLSLLRRVELFHFSGWLFVNNILSFVSNRVPDFVIGKIGGPATLGVYSLANEVSQLPTTELVAPINRAIFPAYVKLSEQKADLREGYLRVIGVIAALTIPAALGIAATAAVFVPLVFGDKWLQAILLIQVLAFYGVIQALQNNVSSVYYALGKPRITTGFALLYNLIMVPSLIFAALHWGSLGAACAMVIAMALVAPFNLATVFRLLELPARAFVSIVWRPLFAGLGMAGLVLALKATLQSALPHLSDLVLLITLVPTGVLAYVLLLLAAWMLSGRPAGPESMLLARYGARLPFQALLRSV
jgi:lipopolysaccharide exporter